MRLQGPVARAWAACAKPFPEKREGLYARARIVEAGCDAAAATFFTTSGAAREPWGTDQRALHGLFLDCADEAHNMRSFYAGDAARRLDHACWHLREAQAVFPVRFAQILQATSQRFLP